MVTRWGSLALFLLSFSLTRASIHDGDENERFLVVRASPMTKDQLEFVRELQTKMDEYNLDFWLSAQLVGDKADMMVRESEAGWLRGNLTERGVPHEVTVPDVQKLILDREHKPKSSMLENLLGTFSRRYRDEGGNKAKYGFGDYHSYDRIIEYMNDIEKYYPDRAKVMTIGHTEENRPIKTIKIGKDITSTSRRVFWLDGGIHAREWAAVHTVLWMLDRLIADYDSDPLVRMAIDNIHFYVTPVLNPDGYEYSRTGVSPMIRLWRKNRAAMTCKKDRWFRERCCGGVDLNRNFDWFWGEIGSSNDRCSEIYQGSAAFSEAESRAVRDMMFSPELKGKVDGFITLHTYSQMWIHPFSHQRKTVPEDIAEQEDVGRRAVAALENVFGTKYRFGTGADILYPSSGGSDDWAKGKGGAKYVYLIELRPGEEVWDGFILDSRQLIPTGKETWAGVKVVLEAVLANRSRAPPPSITTPVVPEAPRVRVTALSTTSIATTTTTASTTTTPWTTTSRPVVAELETGAVPVTRTRTFRINSRHRPVLVSADVARGVLEERFGQARERVRAETQRRTGSSRMRTQRPRVATVDGSSGLRQTAIQPHSPCIDRSPWCIAWKQGNAEVCTVSSIYMRRDCARTCGFCRV